MSVQGNRLILGGGEFDKRRLKEQKEGIALEKGFKATVKRKLGLAEKVEIEGQWYTVNKASARKWFIRTTQTSLGADQDLKKASRTLDKAIQNFQKVNNGLGLGNVLSNHVSAQKSDVLDRCQLSSVSSVFDLLIQEQQSATKQRAALFQGSKPEARPVSLTMAYANEADAAAYLNPEATRRFQEFRPAIHLPDDEPRCACPSCLPSSPDLVTHVLELIPAPAATAVAHVEAERDQAEILVAEQEARNKRNEAISKEAQAEVSQRLASEAETYFESQKKAANKAALLIQQSFKNYQKRKKESLMAPQHQPTSAALSKFTADFVIIDHATPYSLKNREVIQSNQAINPNKKGEKIRKWSIVKSKLPLFRATKIKQSRQQKQIDQLSLRRTLKSSQANPAPFDYPEITAKDYLVPEEEITTLDQAPPQASRWAGTALVAKTAIKTALLGGVVFALAFVANNSLPAFLDNIPSSAAQFH